MFSKDDDRNPLKDYLDQFNLPPWLSSLSKSKRKELEPQLTSIPPLELFLGRERFSTRTLPLSTLLERTLGGNGEGNYQSIDYLLGIKPAEIEAETPGSGLAIALQKIVVSESAGISLGGSIIADCIGTTNEHMVKNSDFLAKMQWLYGKRINPKYLKAEAVLGQENALKPLANHLIRALYGGALDVSKMPPPTYALFRLLQKWAGANADLVIRSPLGNTNESRNLIRDLIATNFAFLDPHHARNISTVSYGRTHLIHIDHPYAGVSGKDINLIVKGHSEEDSYSEITTWRKASTTSVSRSESGVFTVQINPEEFRQYNQMLFTPENYWSWLTYAYKNARTVLVAGVPRVVFDQKSFLEHTPRFNANPTQEQIANIAANAVHASAINNPGFSDIVDALNLAERLNLNDYDEVRNFIKTGLADLFIDAPHENIEPFIDDLALYLTKYLPTSLSRFISLTPDPDDRDQIKARTIIQPLSPRTTRTITPYGAESLKKALTLTKDGLLSPKEIRLIQRDIETLSKV